MVACRRGLPSANSINNSYHPFCSGYAFMRVRKSPPAPTRPDAPTLPLLAEKGQWFNQNSSRSRATYARLGNVGLRMEGRDGQVDMPQIPNLELGKTTRDKRLAHTLCGGSSTKK